MILRGEAPGKTKRVDEFAYDTMAGVFNQSVNPGTCVQGPHLASFFFVLS